MEATIVSILLASAPLIFATLGEAITEKAGVINLSLDGSIVLSAMAGFGVALTTHHALSANDLHTDDCV